MVPACFAVVASLLCLFLTIQLLKLKKNLDKARSTGLKYMILPVHMLSIPWAVTRGVFLPLLDLLPIRWTEGWVPLLVMERGWREGYRPFKTIGADLFIVVTPSQNVLFSCNAEASHQFLTRSHNFNKPPEPIRILNIFGPTITGTDGAETQLYRRVTSPFFNAETMTRVWRKAIEDTNILMQIIDEKHASLDKQLRPLLARMMLHIMASVSFENPLDCKDDLLFAEKPGVGCQMSFPTAMHSVLDNFSTIFLIPRVILERSFLKSHRTARACFDDLSQYLKEFAQFKKSQQQATEKVKKEKSLLDYLVSSGESKSLLTTPLLSQEAVLGNIFIFMFAGHEASANSIHFICLILACLPSMQKAVQTEIDQVLVREQMKIEQISFDRDYAAFSEGLVGAIINEVLRLFTVLPFILKANQGQETQTIVVDGWRHTIPPETLILINTSATHRNPRYWPEPSEEDLDEPAPHVLAAFNPWMWLDDQAALGVNSKVRRSLKPEAGAFVPFSGGSRGCLGYKFALVELCAVVVSIFATHTVELAFPVEGTDDSKDAYLGKWEEAKMRVTQQLNSDGVRFQMSLRMEGTAPLRFVKRGEESPAYA